MKGKQIVDIMEARNVVRFHTEPTMLQSLGEHMHGVALLCHLMTVGIRDLENLVTKNVLLAALCHDLGEKKYGDAPYTAKRSCPELGNLTSRLEQEHINKLGMNFKLMDTQIQLIKICDMLELCFHCKRRFMTGDQFAKTVLFRGLASIGKGSNLMTNRIDEVRAELLEGTDLTPYQFRKRYMPKRAELMEGADGD